MPGRRTGRRATTMSSLYYVSMQAGPRPRSPFRRASMPSGIAVRTSRWFRAELSPRVSMAENSVGRKLCVPLIVGRGTDGAGAPGIGACQPRELPDTGDPSFVSQPVGGLRNRLRPHVRAAVCLSRLLARRIARDWGSKVPPPSRSCRETRPFRVPSPLRSTTYYTQYRSLRRLCALRGQRIDGTTFSTEKATW